jgi:hypothetical protein
VLAGDFESTPLSKRSLTDRGVYRGERSRACAQRRGATIAHQQQSVSSAAHECFGQPDVASRAIPLATKQRSDGVLVLMHRDNSTRAAECLRNTARARPGRPAQDGRDGPKCGAGGRAVRVRQGTAVICVR